MPARKKVIAFLGPPGCGKGTQAALLSPAVGIPAVSTGELLRRECDSGSALGKTLRSVLASGQLVTDDLMNQLIASRLRESDVRRGCILDGYPRTIVQARFLDTSLSDLNFPEPIVLQFELGNEEIVARLGRRRLCPKCGRIFSVGEEGDSFCTSDGAPLAQRPDDKPVTIRERLRLYEHNAGELIQHYARKRLYRIHATGSPAEISREILRLVESAAPPFMSRRKPRISVQANYRVQPA